MPRHAAVVWRCLRLALTAALIAALSLASSEDAPVENKLGHGPWPWQTWIVATLFVLICGCGQLLCCFGCLKAGWERGDFQLGGPYTPLSQKEFVSEANEYRPDHEKIGRVVRQEMRLMLLYPLISILASVDSSCEKGMPLWGYALYVPLLLRAKWIEIKILRALNESWSHIFLAPGLWLGCLEHADWFTDGALPVQAYLCGPTVTERFAESFELSWAWPLAPIVRMLHFWGLLTVVLSFAALSQQLLGSADHGDCHDLAADVPGFGAVANWYEEFEQDHGWKQAAEDTGCLSERALLTSVSKVFLENVAQLWLQASFFALIFGRLHHTGKVKLLISMGLGLISCVCKTLPMAVGLCRAMVSGSVGPEVGFIVLSCQLFAIVGVAWTVAKLFNSFQCPSHLWNLTSGCVPPGVLTAG
ncbi:dcd2A [Symbiodinium natans]|uniref:Dcd2A protein n=1 Tax=Symbiodinium natans TaxID=878477 RepID=A0A812S1H1_9DINO|nr:dcd2A [Symbiodinium natans]